MNYYGFKWINNILSAERNTEFYFALKMKSYYPLESILNCNQINSSQIYVILVRHNKSEATKMKFQDIMRECTPNVRAISNTLTGIFIVLLFWNKNLLKENRMEKKSFGM